MDTYNLDYSLFKENLIRGYRDVKNLESLTDVTLVCDDGEVGAHKLVLFTGSEFFKSFLPRVKHHNPYIYLRGIKMKHLEMALNFMYLGTVQVPQDDIGAILDVANDLKISGLTEEETPKAMQKKDQLKKKEIEETRNTANIVENYQKEATKVAERLDSLMKNLNDMKEKEIGKKDCLKLTDEEKVLTSEEIEEKALSMLKKGFDEEGKISWICKDCGYLCNDKSRSKRHVKNNHIKERRKRSNVSASDVELNFSSVLESMSDDSIVEQVPEIKRPRTRGMKRELEQEIENIEKNEAVESLNESFVEDMLEEHNDAGAGVFNDLIQNAPNLNNDTSSSDLEEQANEMMEKDCDKVAGRVSWICKICDYACNDKSRTRRHVKAKHLPKNDKLEEDQSAVIESNEDDTMEEITEAETSQNESGIKAHVYDNDDVQALSMMSKSMENNKILWTCEVCQYNCNDKTRIRKHVKNSHIRQKQN